MVNSIRTARKNGESLADEASCLILSTAVAAIIPSGIVSSVASALVLL
jgi:hypothetical protein